MIQESKKIFTDAVSLSFSVPIAGIFSTALLKFSAAPSTSENITITFKSANGTEYDTIIYTFDPSDDGETNISYSPNVALPLRKGDSILIEYPNTDAATIGVTLKGLDSANF